MLQQNVVMNLRQGNGGFDVDTSGGATGHDDSDHAEFCCVVVLMSVLLPGLNPFMCLGCTCAGTWNTEGEASEH